MCQNAVKSRFRRVLRYVHLVVSNPCDVCLSSVMLVQPTQRVELLSNIFALSNSLGTRAVCVKFWKEIRRVLV